MNIGSTAKAFVSVVLCETVGIISTPVTLAAIPTWYAALNKPAFSPPNWLFGPVWTILYALMGISFSLIWNQGWTRKKNRNAGYAFLLQLLFNFTWSISFFGLHNPLLGLINIIVLILSILLTIRLFYRVSKTAAYLLVPYLLWVAFASLLNASIVVLNRG